jgi:amino acid transporter
MSYQQSPGVTRSAGDPGQAYTQETKTSAAAVFGLVFGLAALFSVLTVILTPLGLVLGLIGLILAIVGLNMAKRANVTGRGVAIGGLTLSIIALLLGATIAAGATFFVNDQNAVDRVEQQLQEWRDQLPEDVNIDVNQ